MMDRRRFLHAGLVGAGVLGLGACASAPRITGRPRVVVVGGGFGGATLARYLRLWGEGRVDVVLVEPDARFVSCPLSNLVLSGDRDLPSLSLGYENLRDRWGVRWVQDRAVAVDAQARQLRLENGETLSWDRLVLATGVEFDYSGLPGLAADEARQRVPHAWKAGPQTLQLRAQLEALPNGGVFAICVPPMPYRCPPGPYERACLVASYFKRHKPRSRVLVLDANPEIVSKKGLFQRAFAQYKGAIEYRPGAELRDVDAARGLALLDFEDVRADLLNVIPPQRAGGLLADAGLKRVNGRWAEVDWLSFESVNVPGVHVIGDAIALAPGMPKSGHMANQHAKVAADAILRLLAGEAPNPAPVLMNTCYSFTDPQNVIHVASVHQYDAATRSMQPVAGAGGVSMAANTLETRYALNWARNIWADMLA